MDYLAEELALVGRIKPASITAAATGSSDVVDMKNFDQLLIVFNMGDYAAGNNGSVAVVVTGSAAVGMTNTATITGKTLTAANYTGSDGDDAAGIINLRGDEVAAQGFRYVRLDVTPTNQNLIASATILGRARYQPSSNFDLAKVKEIVT